MMGKTKSDDRELQANIAPFGLRMQPDLKERVQEAAERNNRSLNAEIVYRLQHYDMLVESLSRVTKERNHLAHDAESAAEQLADDVREILKSQTIPVDQTLYVALDANGFPVSWAEIMSHLGGIARAAGLEINSMEARVFNAELASDDNREEQWWNLVQHYKNLKKKTKAKKST